MLNQQIMHFSRISLNLLACVLAQSGESVVRPAVDRSMVT